MIQSRDYNYAVRSLEGAKFSAHIAMPAKLPAPGLVLIQEIFGVNKVMRDIAKSFAAQGYIVVCPDLFWRQEPQVQLTDQSEEEWAHAFELMQGMDITAAVDDLEATLKDLREMSNCTGQVGAVGYCMGGLLAYLMRTRTDVDAAVAYYGVMIQNHLGEAGNIAKPLMMHIAEADEYVPDTAQAEIRAALKTHPLVTIHSYPGQDHAFARVGGKHYDEKSAAQANARTADFLKQHLF